MSLVFTLMATKTESDSSLRSKKELTEKFLQLRKQALEDGVYDSYLREVFLKHANKGSTKRFTLFGSRKLFIASAVFVVLGIIYYNCPFTYQDVLDEFYTSRCLVENSAILGEIARPLADCGICRGLSEVPIINNLSEEEFVEKYAYTGRPALVRGETGNWTAFEVFSFDYFKELYTETPDAFEITENECQFFSYQSRFSSLEEMFNMSKERANYEEGQEHWYIGWSNCVADVAKKLRKHYQKPHFLPKDSETSSLDWIFMGWSGDGAAMHLDQVQRPSWQAQIKGEKTWYLLPPPECEDVCNALEVTVKKGDIILLDTNQWYHSTYIHEGEMSITIGSEYD
ncbi:uncharacterized protein LOC106169944 [Lingula anatina]|uniref:Uncharacterized protein LOC106169944 n=1 Tax=Lingula anatina TaxID=7574 RepID=A0A1S3J463_LINAN|nr:uncharacterized protein LOC106169944 [Lingula anatina]|eukprot:XP_013405068.1 uncharacterized protein LOC106169944 [Lingula anatina]